jgi:hypothetical protein
MAARMDYIASVDEQLGRPPFELEFQGHHFLLDTTSGISRLRSLVDSQLNAVFPDKALSVGSGIEHKVSFKVTPTAKPFLSIVRYNRVAPRDALPASGWFKYNEIVIYFPVERWIEGNPIGESLLFVGVVYIDDSEFEKQLQDPLTVPILAGREAYGMPKGPGEIRYNPTLGGSLGYPQPKLQIWDQTGGNRLALLDAIVFEQTLFASIRGWVAGVWQQWWIRREPDREASRETDREFTARRLGIRPADIRAPNDDEVEAVRELASISPGWGPLDRDSLKQRVSIAQVGSRRLMLWNALAFNVKLVGKKQLPDPTSDPLYPKACYHAVVETPMEENAYGSISTSYFTLKRTIHFPLRTRVDLIDAFDIAADVSRRYGVEDCYYQSGKMIFADPNGTVVWEPV